MPTEQDVQAAFESGIRLAEAEARAAKAEAAEQAARPPTTKTATIETIAAHVHTLVVGRRQVTLSVFQQLDIVHPKDIEALGRVRPRRSWGRVHIVGISTRAETVGTMVRSWSPVDSGESVCWLQHRSRDCNCHSDFHMFSPEAFDRLAGPTRLDAWNRLPLLVLSGLF